MEATKQTIDTYYTCRTHVPMFFANRDLQAAGTKRAMNTIFISSFPKKTHEGCVVFYGALKDTDPANFDMAEIFKLAMYVFDLHFVENGSADGYRIVIDLQGIQFGHVAKLAVLPIKHFLYYIQEAMPVRLKGFHFVNIVPFMDIIMGLMKPFLKKELLSILHLHPSCDEMLQYIGKECLPEDIGGKSEGREVLTKKCFDRLLEIKEYFLEEEKTMRVNEGKRPGKPKTAGEFSGIEGNFRKLDID